MWWDRLDLGKETLELIYWRNTSLLLYMVQFCLVLQDSFGFVFMYVSIGVLFKCSGLTQLLGWMCDNRPEHYEIITKKHTFFHFYPLQQHMIDLFETDYSTWQQMKNMFLFFLTVPMLIFVSLPERSST